MKRSPTRLASLLLAVAMLISIATPAAADDGLDAWTEWLENEGPSHASGQREDLGPYLVGDPTDAVHVVRVGIHASARSATGACPEFTSLHHRSVRVSGRSGFQVLDLATGLAVAAADAGATYEVTFDGAGYVLRAPDGSTRRVAGPVRFAGAPGGTFLVPSVERTRSCAAAEYRGFIDVDRGPGTPAGLVNLVNVVELEDYLRGVIVNESPAWFHIEALKTQAVAARGYAVANVGRYVTARGLPFDLVDSAASQVYRGRLTEHPNADIAVSATHGLVATHNGEIITAYYSSSMGGHPESYAWIRFGVTSEHPPYEGLPYLVGRYDGPPGTAPDLRTEAGQRAFWTNDQPDVYDSRARSRNPRNRWANTWPRDEMEAHLARPINSPVRSISGAWPTTAQLQGCDVTLRSPTGRAFVVQCAFSDGGLHEWVGWRNLRAAFGRRYPDGLPLNNPSFIDNVRGSEGELIALHVTGGGWGHNLGMSQWGAHGRGLAGQSFTEIVTFYYKDTAIGSHPIVIRAGQQPPPRRQTFGTPTGRGIVEIRPRGGLGGLVIVVNDDQEIRLGEGDLQDVRRIDITRHLRPGVNSVQYRPLGTQGSASVFVEVHR